MQEIKVQPLGQKDPLEKGMVINSSILAWRIPRTEKPGRLQSTGSQSQTQLSDLTLFNEKVYSISLILPVKNLA